MGYLCSNKPKEASNRMIDAYTYYLLLLLTLVENYDHLQINGKDEDYHHGQT